jgi:NADH-quinone oxidoreductase subunit C
VSERMEAVALQVDAHLNDKVKRVASLGDELAYEVEAAELLSVCRTLRDAPELKFEMLMDVSGVDYLHHGRDEWQTVTATRSGFSRGRVARSDAPDPEMQGRFAVVYQLLSITHNRRLRLRAKCPDTSEPVGELVRA